MENKKRGLVEKTNGRQNAKEETSDIHHHHYYYYYYYSRRRRRRRTMFLNVLLLLVVLLGGTGKASSSSSSCSYQSGCNRPKQRFASSTLGNHDDDDVSITFRQTPNFPATMRDSVEKGVELAQSFLGKVSDVDVFMYEAQNASAQNPSAYEEINGLWCEATRDEVHGYCNDGAGNQEKAMNGENNVFASGKMTCAPCGEPAKKSTPIVITPGLDSSGEYYEHDTDWLIQGAIHEYSHAFQTLFGAHTPAWLMEGGAVQLEAVFSNHASRGTYRKTYEDHFKHTIFPAAIDLYGNTSVATWLTTYGSDRECENDIPPGGVNANPDVFYNVGAAAVAFAIYKANINHAADGGRTFADFWTNTEKHKGFWHSIVVDDYEFNIDTDWPSQVPEGTGWKGALANFTGHDSVAAFYADFEAWIKPGGVLKTPEEMSDILENSSDVDALSVEPFNNANSFMPRSCEASGGPPSSFFGVSSSATHSRFSLVVVVVSSCLVATLAL